MTSPEILPCPFCGGECDTLHLENFTGTRMYSVTCVAHMQDCKVRGCQYESARNWTESEAITAHNRVAGAAQMHGELVRMLAGYRMCTKVGVHPDPDVLDDIDALLARIDALGGGK